MDNLNEILGKAKKGDSGAMEQLVAYYREHGNEGEAIRWEVHLTSTRAAAFALMSMSIGSATAHGALHIGAWDEVEKAWEEIYQQAKGVLASVNDGDAILDREHIESVNDLVSDACYNLALVAYIRDNDYQNAIQRLNESVSLSQSSKTQALLGLCLFKAERYGEAFSILDSVSRAQEYANSEKDLIEEAIYAEGLGDLATIYRIGIPGVVQQNLDKAVSILNISVIAVKDPDYRSLLQAELNRYRKKLFGGYQYR